MCGRCSSRVGSVVMWRFLWCGVARSDEKICACDVKIGWRDVIVVLTRLFVGCLSLFVWRNCSTMLCNSCASMSS
jgi:hypothetical protein